MVYQYSEIHVSSKKEWTTDTYNNVVEYAEQKNPDKKIHTVWLYLFEILETGRQRENRLAVALGW